MDHVDCKRSGHIPAFGNWDYANDLPITQYFESAREAGLIRYSSSSGNSIPYARSGAANLYSAAEPNLRAARRASGNAKTRGRENLCAQVKEHRKQQQQQGKVCDVKEPPSKLCRHLQNDAVSPPRRPRRVPKPVDEDLYQIPPELLHTTKRKKMLGFISRCLVPCTA